MPRKKKPAMLLQPAAIGEPRQKPVAQASKAVTSLSSEKKPNRYLEESWQSSHSFT